MIAAAMAVKVKDAAPSTMTKVIGKVEPKVNGTGLTVELLYYSFQTKKPLMKVKSMPALIELPSNENGRCRTV